MTDTDLRAALDEAGETIAALRLALLNAETERDTAQAEAAELATLMRTTIAEANVIFRHLGDLCIAADHHLGGAA